ncbi:pyruvate, water dikinase [Nocardia amikacinitolerans]|uniref:PEP/pyruvate-binding domain-containing protein n=1 Tax=Nocardia amikacinitolerans TaxID=756689 RepID=UPI00082BBB9F|nr:PEP/pyruvate-binding domain-containing protein [Nocardia amikacinitolerans]MCP2314817.1 pyruvate, water dikinase [Nocardia amikacinitolerans]
MTITTTTTNRPGIVALRDPRARDAELTGAKAAALATAAAHGLPVLEGFVLTTAWSHRGDPPEAEWRGLSGAGAKALVVRSSSVAEDGAHQSMAGLFTSVLDVRDWQGFRDAVDEVLASGPPADLGAGVDAAMAVLVQPFLAAGWGGVVFTADPVTGRTDRMMITASRRGPSAVVGGAEGGWTATTTRRGRVTSVATPDADPLPNALRRKVIRLALRAERVFGGALDIEWAIDARGRVILLQARPVTALHGPVRGPVLGPGPLAETFPDPLRPLEQDLWLAPLADGLRVAVDMTGAAPPRALHESPVATAVRGIAVADLELLGVVRPRRTLARLLDPRPGARRLGAAMRVGRLAAALPELAQQICERVDTDLAEVPPLAELTDLALLAVLDNARTALTALHGYEALAGMLGGKGESAPTAAEMALSALAAARATGLPEERVIEELPVVLALIPPRIGPPPRVPEVDTDPLPIGEGAGELALAREALRLRARWVQELGARAAWELGSRLAATGLLDDPGASTLLSLEELRTAVRYRRLPDDLSDRTTPDELALPAEFRLATDGFPIAVSRGRGRADRGIGAGGGVGRGMVHIGDHPPAGSVLVVRHLDPRLAVVVPRLSGLIAETGSPLSHLAILAREYGVPVVVGYPDATRRLPDGAVVQVDGRSGEVRPSIETEEHR